MQQQQQVKWPPKENKRNTTCKNTIKQCSLGTLLTTIDVWRIFSQFFRFFAMEHFLFSAKIAKHIRYSFRHPTIAVGVVSTASGLFQKLQSQELQKCQ